MGDNSIVASNNNMDNVSIIQELQGLSFPVQNHNNSIQAMKRNLQNNVTEFLGENTDSPQLAENIGLKQSSYYGPFNSTDKESPTAIHLGLSSSALARDSKSYNLSSISSQSGFESGIEFPLDEKSHISVGIYSGKIRENLSINRDPSGNFDASFVGIGFSIRF